MPWRRGWWDLHALGDRAVRAEWTYVRCLGEEDGEGRVGLYALGIGQ